MVFYETRCSLLTVVVVNREERMQARENRLTQEVSKAEAETRRFDSLRKDVDGVS